MPPARRPCRSGSLPASTIGRHRDDTVAVSDRSIPKGVEALTTIDLIARSGKDVDELTADLKVFPQVIVNIRVREKRPLDSIPAVAIAIQAAEADLKDSGRVVIRYSGTEALARVMIEAESEDAMQHHAGTIAAAIRHELGV